FKGALDGRDARAPLAIVEAPAKTLHADVRHRDRNPAVCRGGKPGLDAALRDAGEPDALRVDVLARDQVVDEPHDVPGRVEVKRVALPAAERLCDGRVVFVRALAGARAFAVEAAIDGDADKPGACRFLHDLGDLAVVLAAAGAMQGDDHRTPALELRRIRHQ